jgi:protein gp37
MANKTGIQWTDATWNPTVGCDQISPGCAHCYAKDLHDMRHRASLAGHAMAPQYAQPFEVLQMIGGRLDTPLHWRKPRRVFVNSVSDLFHDDVPWSFIERVFDVMQTASRHTFQILTKRAENMRQFVESWAFHHGGPLSNVWLGVSVENQRFADERIPLLLKTPAAVRFISAEPLLGPVSLYPQWMPAMGYDSLFPRLDWVIVGGESGPNARPLHIEWIRSIARECLEQREPFTGKVRPAVPVFVKQLGAAPTCGTCLHPSVCWCGENLKRLRDSHGGEPTEWPEDLRVRQFPNGGR